MKKLILALLGFLPLLLSAQTFVIDGTVTSGSTGNPVANYPVEVLFSPNSGSTQIFTVNTNSSGFYTHTFTAPGTQGGVLSAEIMDCTGSVLSDSSMINPGNPNATIDFVYCDTSSTNPTGCTPSVINSVNGTNVVFSVLSPISTTTYTWTLPNGNITTGTSATFAIPGSGTYQACVTATDAVLGCTATVCDSVTVSICDTNFVTTVGTTITHSMVSPSASATYTWTLPNGTTATGANVSYQASTLPPSGSGNYTVCVTASDTAFNCQYTNCGMFYYVPGTPQSISGNIFANFAPVQSAVVYLIELDSNAQGNSILTAVDSTYTQQGYYTFTNVANGTYMVKAALTSQDTNYLNYLPTYYAPNVANNVGVLYWQNSTAVSVVNNAVTVSFGLVPGNNPGGSGFIGGLVSQGANKTNGPGDALEGVLVLLLDENDNPSSFAISNSTGEFAFNNIELGLYTVLPEVPGIDNNGALVEVNQDNNDVTNLVVKVNSTFSETYFDQTTSVSEVKVSTLEVYPNPASESVTLSVGTDWAQTDHLQVEVMSITGSVLLTEKVTATKSTTLDISELPAGIYMIYVKSDNLLKVSKLVVE